MAESTLTELVPSGSDTGLLPAKVITASDSASKESATAAEPSLGDALIFAAGQSTILASPGSDDVNLGSSAGTVGAAAVVWPVTDVTAVATPRISVSNLIVGEGDGHVDIVVKLSAPGQNEVKVNYTTADYTADRFGDYVAAAGTLTFAPGVTEQTVSITLRDDLVTENYESFQFQLNTPTNATIAQSYALVGIVDNDRVVDTPELFVRDVVVDEKAGTASFVVMMGGPHGQASNSTVTVGYATADATATAGSDYVATSGTLTFAAGETAKTVVVDLKDDTTAESFERFALNLSNASGATIMDGHAVATIGANDATAVAQPRISVANMIVGEGDGYVDIVVSLSAPGQNEVKVNYTTADYTADRFGDYAGVSGTLTFATGETTKVVRVELRDDLVTENYESFQFQLNTPTNATIAQSYALVGIVDNDRVVDTPELFVRDVVVDEKAGTASFVVMMGGPHGQASNSTVTVGYATADATATAGSDYVATSGTLTFAAGETAKTVVVDLKDDTTAESFERFALNLSNASGATIMDGHAVATIGANDATAVAQPRISVANMIVGEGDGYVDIVVSLSAPGQNEVKVNYTTADYTADRFGDYAGVSGTLTFATGETTKVVRVELRDDLVTENYESFQFQLNTPTNATIAQSYALVGIVDNDRVVDTPELFVRDVVVDEKAGTASFVVMMGGPHGQASNSTVTVGYATADATATAGSDYVATSGTLTFAAGETAKTVVVDLKDDTTAESFERFALNLSNASGATIMDGHAVATIGANDATAVAQPRISVANMIVGEGDGYVDIVVSLSAPGQNEVKVNYTTADYTADRFGDYAGVSGTLTFATGETTKVVRVELRDDLVTENYESFQFQLNTPTNATIAQSYALVGIVDNDRVVDTPELFVRDVVVDEKAGTASFVVMMGGPHGQASNSTVTVGYATADATATAGSDYVATSGTLTFAAGETAKTVVVDLKDDTTAESFERFALNLSNASGATIMDGHAVATIGANDATAVAQPRISVANMIVGEGDGYVDIVVSLSAPGQNEVKVNYTTADYTADRFGDYAGVSGTLTFATGETTKVVRVELRDDLVTENYESFQFQLNTPTNATIAQSYALVGIVDNDRVVDTPELFVRDVVVDEKAGTASFVVMMGGPHGQASNSTVTVGYATADATATAGSDYVATSGTLTFAAGETAKTVVVDLKDDTTAESFERFALNLSNASGATIMDGHAVAEIGANDQASTAQAHLSVADTRVAEGDGYVDLRVTLSAPAQSAVSVNYTTADSTADRFNDYAFTSGTLNFAIGETTKVVRVELRDDTVEESVQSFLFNLSTPSVGAVIDKASATVSIVDNDAPGVNVLSYGRSDDVYVVNASSDVIVENPGGGHDLVLSSATYTLGAQVEDLTLTGSDIINGTGNELANRLSGNGAANTLNGLAGNDTLSGGAGNDTLNGGTGADVLSGGTGADSMVGGDGNDSYTVDNIHDVVLETNAVLATGGRDLVNSSLASYTLGANVEDLRITATGAANGTGNSLANTLFVGAGNNVLNGGSGSDTASYLYASAAVTVSLATTAAQATGGSGSDTLLNIENLTGSRFNDKLTGSAAANVLDGGLGADTLTGGDGSDTYVVDNINDLVLETNAVLATGGRDLVNSSLASYTLGANVEDLRITATGAANGTGNSLANTLFAGAGNNVLNGGSGSDTASYLYASAAVTVSLATTAAQATGGSGSDTLLNIENLTGSRFNDKLTGSSSANVLAGGAGADTLTGGAGTDTFLFSSVVGADRVTDFFHADDTLSFSQAGIRVGNGDSVIDAAAARSVSGGFSTASELVVFTANIAGDITANNAATQIGSATSAFSTGATRLFVVDNGTQSGVFLFHSSGADAVVSASELTLVALVDGETTTLSDYTFSP